MAETPDTQKSSAKFTLIAIIVLILIAVAAYFYFSKPSETTDNSTSNTYNTEMVTIPAGGSNDDTSNEVEEASSSVDMSTWVRVPEDGYEFMHPDYYINDNGDHYIIAYEPRIGQEFSAMVIYKPVDVADPSALLQQKTADYEELGAEILREPNPVTAPEGFKAAYRIQYEMKSGPTTGTNEYFLVQSPYTDKWVAIEYPVHPTSEAIRDSFQFMRNQ